MQESINTDSERGDIAPPCFKKHMSLDEFGKSGSTRQKIQPFRPIRKKVVCMHVRICDAL